MRWKIFVATLLVLAGILFPRSSLASEWYVSPSGTSSANGTINDPWDLQTALNQPSSVIPGDTVWLRGGTYTGTFSSTLVGTSASPIVVRQYASERAKLDGSTLSANAVLQVNGSYTYYWGFEISRSDTNRVSSQTSSAPTDIVTTNGIYTATGAGNKFINLVVHDTGQGYGFWTPALNSEIYGNLIYYNGWQAPDRGHGHGIYTQNNTGTKNIKDNIIFNQSGWGIHAYTEGGTINNFDMDGNIAFNNGALASQTSYYSNILLGGLQVASNNTISSNYTYYDSSKTGGSNNLGYSAGCNTGSVTNNYFAHVGKTALSIINCTNLTVTGNTFLGTASFSSTYPNNTYSSTKPTNNVISVTPNQYDSDRANIVVYNWEQLSTVSVNPSEVLANNQNYSVYDVQNFFGDPIASGTYTGLPISIPMNSTAVAAPVGLSAPPHTSSEFGVFVLIGGAVVDSVDAGITSTSASNVAGIKTCDANTPSPPVIWLDSVSTDSITLQIRDRSSENIDSHYIMYGTESNSNQFGSGNIGGSSLLTYKVSSLQPSTRYFFKVRAGNGCATGDWSNEISAKTLSRYYFLTTEDLETEINETEIKEKEVEKRKESIKEDQQEDIILGVNVKIKVVDGEKKPVEGAKVTLHSTPRETVTDKEGIARFEKVETGEHRVIITYQNQKGEQEINLQDDPNLGEVDFAIQLKSTSPFKEPSVMATIGGLALALIAVIGLLLKRRSG